VKQELLADVVHLCIYDPRVHLFRPMGITVSENNIRQLLRDTQTLANMGLGMYDDSTRKELLKQYTEEGEKGGTHGLIEHAVASLLQPKPHGLTETVSRTREGIFLPDARTHRGRADKESLAFAKSRLVLPFTQDNDATPGGILWACWSQPPYGLAELGSLVNDSDAFSSRAGQRLAAVSEVVAAMYAIHRYCNPDAVADPLPIFHGSGGEPNQGF
jgi:hypothetical protein